MDLICLSESCQYQILCSICIEQHKGHLVRPITQFIKEEAQNSAKLMRGIEKPSPEVETELMKEKGELEEVKKRIEGEFERIMVEMTKMVTKQMKKQTTPIKEKIDLIDEIVLKAKVMTNAQSLLSKQKAILKAYNEGKLGELGNLFLEGRKLFSHLEELNTQHLPNLQRIKQLKPLQPMEEVNFSEMQSKMSQILKQGE